jgi:CHAT domain-containing protein
VKRATRKEIRDALLSQAPDVVQFVVHGVYRDGSGYLALVDEATNKTWLVNEEGFANLFLGHDRRLGMVSLATCESARSDEPQGFTGIAPQLVQRGVPAVLTMQYSVSIDTAQIFLEDFCTYASAHKPIDWSVQHARNAIAAQVGLGRRDFSIPVLYMRASDGVVF